LSPNLNLTRGQKAKLSAGECPGLTGTGTCPVERGDEVQVAANLTIRVVRVDGTPQGWKLRYELHDRRDPARLLRRTPPVVVPRGEDHPDEDAIKRAARESSYTTSPVSAISDAGEAVDEKTQQRFTKEAREGFGAHLERERKERQARRLDERLRNVQALADRRGVDLTRKLASIEKRIEAAEREVGREDAA
jgi:hypothetical protein